MQPAERARARPAAYLERGVQSLHLALELDDVPLQRVERAQCSTGGGGGTARVGGHSGHVLVNTTRPPLYYTVAPVRDWASILLTKK